MEIFKIIMISITSVIIFSVLLNLFDKNRPIKSDIVAFLLFTGYLVYIIMS